MPTFDYTNVTVGPAVTWDTGNIFTSNVIRSAEREQETILDRNDMPSISVVDGEIVIRNPSTFRSVAQLCTSVMCPRREECLRNIGNINALGRPTKEMGFTHNENGCGYFLPRTPEHINQLRERGVNGLRSAWRM